MKEKEPRKEDYFASCTVCDWNYWRGGDRKTVHLVALGHEFLTGHKVLVQGECHADVEYPTRLT
jgi:hypothetical protein